MHHTDQDDELVQGIAPGTPFGDEVERLLSQDGGPVDANPAVARAAAARLRARMGAPASRASVRTWGLVGGLAAAVALVGVWRAPPNVTQATAPAPSAWVHVIQTPDARIGRSANELRLAEGAVRLPDTPEHGVVAFAGLNATFLPAAGSDVVVGVHGPILAIGVIGGSGTLESTGAERLTLRTGEWAVLANQVVDRFDGRTPPDWTALPDTTSALITRLRWLALPEATRQGVAP